MANSFYGGLNGQSFAYKTIFTTYKELQNDLTKGWASSVSVGEYVLISYGMPNDPGYEGYKQIDLDYTFETTGEHKTYNSTLWQKKYNENANGNIEGLYYELITSMTGNTPKVTIQEGKALDADEPPRVDVDHENVDNPLITVFLPQSQVIDFQESIDLDADQSPQVIWNDQNSTEGNPLIPGGVNRPTLQINLPISQVISEATIEEILPALSEPQVRLDRGFSSGDTGTVNCPILRFKLPKSQTWQIGTIDVEVLDADEEPAATVVNSDLDQDIKILKLSLPRSQVMAVPVATDPVNSTQSPSVTDIGSVNAPKLQFTLPRAAKFIVAEYEASKTPLDYELEEGDFLIDSIYGVLYKVENNIVTEKTRLQVEVPDIETSIISPYKENEGGGWTTNNPTANETIVSTTEDGVEWKIVFGLPNAPIFEASATEVASDSQASAAASIKDADTVAIAFQIPRGSRLFTSDTPLDGAMSGDFKLDKVTGIVSRFNGTDWIDTETDLTGPTGPALNIVAKVEATGTELKDEIVLQAIQNTVAGIQGYEYSNEDIFAVTWTDTDDGAKSSYWYYCINTEDPGNVNSWGRAALTGSVSSFLSEDYIAGADASEKAYAAIYINKLIAENPIDMDKNTYNATTINSKLGTINTAITNLETSVNNKIGDLGEQTVKQALDSLSTEVTENINQVIEDVNNVINQAEIDMNQAIEEAKAEMQTQIDSVDEKLSWGTFAELVAAQG